MVVVVLRFFIIPDFQECRSISPTKLQLVGPKRQAKAYRTQTNPLLFVSPVPYFAYNQPGFGNLEPRLQITGSRRAQRYREIISTIFPKARKRVEIFPKSPGGRHAGSNKAHL